MDKQILQELLEQGKTNREIGEALGYSKSNVGYWIKKQGLAHKQKKKKPIYHDKDYFKKIDNPAKAYILGFILGDGCLTEDLFIVSIALSDKEILDFISSETGCNVNVSKKCIPKQRIFPNSSIHIGEKKMLKHLKTLFGGNLKEDRRIPIISKKYERYLLQGFFDAEGCVTWGRRKDRNRLWHKISFTSSLSLLVGIQNILLSNEISTKLKPKSDNSNCYVIEFANKKDIKKFLDIIYPNDDFIILKRKYEKAKTLRLELGEFGET